MNKVSSDLLRSAQTTLCHGKWLERIEALGSLTPEMTNLLLDEVSMLTNHWRPEVRIAALRALSIVDPQLITQVIADCLCDGDREVRRLASELFHREVPRLAA